MHLVGFAVLVVFVAAQVPAVLYLGRYFEREADDSPALQFWREGGPRERGDDDPRPERAGTHGGGAEAGARADDGVEVIAAADAADATRDRRRCPTCGADNHPEYAYCHGCLSELPPGEDLD